MTDRPSEERTIQERVELLPCPFCGSAMMRDDDDAERGAFVVCTGCEAYGPSTTEIEGVDYAEARLRWNRRADTRTEERAILTELLRLYDWRKELAERERLYASGHHRQSPASDLKDVKRDLVKYGREKAAAWERVREILSRPPGGTK